MMTLFHRGRNRGGLSVEERLLEDSHDTKPPLNFGLRHIAALLGGILGFLGLAILIGPDSASHTSSLRQDEVGFRTTKREISNEASLLVKLKLASSQGDAVALGPHQVHVQLAGNFKSCPYPRFFIRLVGDALVRVHLEQHGQDWRGSFTLPMPGSYKFDTRWYGCSPDQNSWTGLAQPIELSSMETSAAETGSSVTSPLFADSAWVANAGETAPSSAQYVWKRPQKEELSGKVIRLDDKSAPVVVEGTTRQPDGFYKFGQLGNYELVCFMGSKSAEDIRSKFLSLRPHLFAHQRPFKFHYYSVTDLVHPDNGWTRETKERLRKCKHILVDVSEMDKPLSQDQYREQIKTFIGHLLKLMNDDTFPIWVFTVNESPLQPTNCHSPSRPRTSDHPCNDVLKDLFLPGSKSFPDRVHLLDNTDLSNPQFDQNRHDVLTIIALRVFVFVGKRVAEWRAAGQHGKIDGLHRNGKVEPNFKLVPYEGWA